MATGDAAQLALEQFEISLLDFASEDLGSKRTSQLLALADRIKTGTAKDQEFRQARVGALQFIEKRLPDAARELQRAFFLFLIQSEWAEESPEIRKALYYCLLKRLDTGIDGLAIEISATLLRSNKIPSAAVLSATFEKARAAFSTRPSWQLAGLLAAAVDRVKGHTYQNEDLISDLAKLDAGDENAFVRAVRMRQPIWSSLPKPMDSVEIVSRVRGRHIDHMSNYPTSFSSDLDSIFANATSRACFMT